MIHNHPPTEGGNPSGGFSVDDLHNAAKNKQASETATDGAWSYRIEPKAGKDWPDPLDLAEEHQVNLDAVEQEVIARKVSEGMTEEAASRFVTEEGVVEVTHEATERTKDAFKDVLDYTWTPRK